MAAIFGERKFFENRKEQFAKISCGSKISTNFIKAITINNNTKQAIDPIILRTKFYKDELNMFPLKE